MTAPGSIALALARRLAGYRWIAVATALGLLVIALFAVLAAGDADAAARDDLRRAVAGLLLVGGMAVALGLGAGALNTDADGGHHGLLLATGVSRVRLVVEVVLARTTALMVVLAAWGAGAQAASLALGLGLDGPLAVHTLTMAETLALALLGAVASSSVVGRIAAGIGGLGTFVVAQAVVNLKAAADDGVIGTAGDGINAVYFFFPRTITSPMIAELQERDAAGIAAPQIDINGNIVSAPPSTAVTVAWTLVWCGILVALAVGGYRRRTVN